jgi:hypothetical protein
MTIQTRKPDSRKLLTDVDSILHNPVVIKIADIVKRLQQQLESDARHLESNYAEQNKLRPHVLRFRDLESDAKAREGRLQRTMALLGEDRFPDAGTGDDSEKSDDHVLITPSDLPLWSAIQGILEQVSDIQVVELQLILEQLGKKVSRQAIESALATHKNLFSIRTRGREKFVSLKR